MDEPYGFIKCSTINFFDEAAGLTREKIDLMSFPCDDELSFGFLDNIVLAAREALTGVPAGFPRAVLWVGDSLLESILDNISVRDSKGGRIDPNNLEFAQLNQFDFVHLVLLTLGTSKLMLGDEDHGIGDLEVTPVRFCAAYALRMAFNATRDCIFDGELRNYYLMQSAAAYGLMQSFRSTTEMSISDAVNISLRRQVAKRSADARWEQNGANALRKTVHNEWDRWQQDRSLYRYPRDFRRAMQLRFPDLIDGTLKNWMSAWGRGQAQP